MTTAADLDIPSFLDRRKGNSMNALARVSDGMALPALIDRAAQALAGARTSAEILEARDMAGVAYDAAKKAARFATAKGAHDAVVAATNRAQADALEIEAGAKRRLADEYDAAQERGEVARLGDNLPKISNGNSKATLADIGLSPKQIHEARIIRDAEVEEPGIVRRVLDDALDAAEEPTRAKVTRAVKAKSKRKRHAKPEFNSAADTQHDRDLRALLGMWESACESAREEFLKQIVH